MTKPDRFIRTTGTRQTRKLFIIATEGTNTEPEYFSSLNARNASIQLIFANNQGTSPLKLLKKLKEKIKSSELKSSDEAWLVIDRDSWAIDQIDELYCWTNSQPNYHLALSNPYFEYWVLLHYENGRGISGISDLDARIKRNIPDYDKHLDMRKITDDMISQAISRAIERDNPPCERWPEKQFVTTVYRLVEKLIN